MITLKTIYEKSNGQIEIKRNFIGAPIELNFDELILMITRFHRLEKESITLKYRDPGNFILIKMEIWCASNLIMM
jgi:hypothetical protein